MQIHEEPTRSSAYEVARKLPVPPIGVVYEDGFWELFKFLYGLKGVGNAQTKLSRAIAENTLMKAEPGTKAKVVYWDGAAGFVAGFDRAGNQVAFGEAIWSPDPLNLEANLGLMAYKTAYVVSPSFQGQGIGSAMGQLLEVHVATNNMGNGATFFYDIQAETPDAFAAAQSLVKKSGAIPSSVENNFFRTLLKSQFLSYASPDKGIVCLPSDRIEKSLSY